MTYEVNAEPTSRLNLEDSFQKILIILVDQNTSMGTSLDPRAGRLAANHVMYEDFQYMDR